MRIPASITVGDSASWDDDPVDVSGIARTSADYVLTYALRGPTDADLTAISNGSGWRTSLSTTVSGELEAGTYAWSAVLTKTGERYTVASGQIAVAANLAAASTPYDPRSSAKRILDALNAYLEGSATKNHLDVIESEIATRRIKRDKASLLVWRDKLRSEVIREEQAASIAAGLGNPRRLHVRFN
jgi:hypothetical protein